MKLDVVAICAGLLHDVVEDTLVSPSASPSCSATRLPTWSRG